MGEERGQNSDDAAIGDDSAASSFTEKWGWIAVIDRVSEITRLTWRDVFSMAIMEVLNIYSYGVDKDAERERQRKLFEKK